MMTVSAGDVSGSLSNPRFRCFIGAIAVSLCLTACESLPADAMVGLSVVPGGGITAVVACKTALVNSVQLSTLDQPTRVLWEIRRRAGAPGRYDFQVGIAPAGYWTAQSFVGRVPATLGLDLRVAVAVGKTNGRIPISVLFHVGQLRADRLFSGHGQSLSSDEFRRTALKAC